MIVWELIDDRGHSYGLYVDPDEACRVGTSEALDIYGRKYVGRWVPPLEERRDSYYLKVQQGESSSRNEPLRRYWVKPREVIGDV